MPGTISLASNEISIGEADGFALVTFKRVDDLTGAVNITYGITSDTALAGQDFTGGGDGIATIPDGQDRVTISIPILNDALSEATETFVVSIVTVDNGFISAPRTTRISIFDNENPVQDPPDPPAVSNYDVTLLPLLSGFRLPIKMEFDPLNSNQVFVAEKGGLVKIANIQTGVKSTFLDLTGVVNDVQDRGLMDIAFHPNYATNHYFYAFFVVDPPETVGNTGLAGPNGVGNRFAYVERFTADAATNYTTVVPGSGVVILGNGGDSLGDISGGGAIDSTNNFTIPSSETYLNPNDPAPRVVGGYKQDYIKVDASSHAGGALEFGPDGALYVTIGEGTSFNRADPRSVSVQSVNSLSGKVLRVDPLTGDGYTTNPFYTPGMSLDDNAAKVYQLGFRNPFSTAFTPDGRLVVADTGWNTYERILIGPAGSNFGWPYYEGADGGLLNKTPQYKDIPEAAAFYAQVASGQITIVPPFRAFAHATSAPGYQMQAITAGDVVYTGNKYPAVFQNDFFFTDFPDGEIFTVDVNNRQQIEYLLKMPAGRSGPIDYQQGPDGYIYYVDLVPGVVGRMLIADKPVDPTSFKVNGSAAVGTAVNDYVLTNGVNQAGSLVSQSQIDVRDNFSLAFRVMFGQTDAGGEGVAFVLHNDARGSSAIGNGGAGLGFEDIQNGLAISFDTFTTPGRADLATDGGSFVNSETLTRTLPVNLGNLEDGGYHDVVVTWSAATSTLTYSVDGVVRGTLTDPNIVATYFGGSSHVNYGFTASTGATASAVTHVTLGSVSATYFTSGNHDPVAVDDTYVAGINGVLQIPLSDLLRNDTDADANTLTISAVSNVQHGTAVITGAQVVFTPAADYIGPASFDYKVRDGRGGQDTGTAAIDVRAVAPQSYILNGSATAGAAPGTYTLTPALGAQTGSVMSTARIDLASSFTISYREYFGAADSGADGSTFVLHNDARGTATMGYGGAGFGAGQIKNGLAVAFDTFYNATRGDLVNDSSAFENTAAVTFPQPRVDLGNIEDGLLHPIVVSWNAATSTLSYSVDGVVRGSLTDANIINTYFGGSRYVYFGFTGSTGGTANEQRIIIDQTQVVYEGGAPPVNTNPVAVADNAATTQNVAATIAAATLLSNDTDANGDALTLTSVLNPVNGAVTLVNNVITFTPNTGFVGAGTFNYTISDGKSGTATGLVTVNVTAPQPNSNPVAVADNVQAQQNVPAVIPAASMLSNDTDANGDALTLTSVLNPVNGAVTLVNNLITFTPNTGFIGAGTFNYTISDGKSGTATGLVTVNVTPPQPQSYVLNGSATAGAAPGTYTLTPALGAQTGSVMSTARIDLASSFTISYREYFGAADSGADGSAFVLHNDARGTATMGYGGAGFGAGQIKNGLAVAFDTFYNATRGDLVNDSSAFENTAAVTFPQPRVDLGNIEDGLLHPIVVSWNAATSTLSYSVDGVVRGTLTDANIINTYFGGSRYVYFGFTGSTGGTANEQRIIIDQTQVVYEGGAPPVNTNPVAVADNAATTQNVAATIAAATLLSNDTDANGDALTLTSVLNPVNGAVTLVNNLITFTPTTGFIGAGTFNYTISDGKSGTATGLVTVNVTGGGGSNPVGVTDAYTLAEDTPLPVSATRNVLGNDTPAAGLTAALVTGPTHGALTLNANGTFLYTPAANYFGPDSFTYTANNGATASAPTNVALTITGTPDAPLIAYGVAGTVNISIAENANPIIAHVLASDPDGGAITYSLTGPDAADYSISSTGILRLIAAPNFEAPTDDNVNNYYNVTVNVRDTSNALTKQSFSVKVVDVAEDAVIVGGDDGATINGTAGSDRIQASGGNDTVNGLAGNDLFLASLNDGNDAYKGGGGADTVSYAAITTAVTANLTTNIATGAQIGTDTFTAIENLIGGAAGDTLIGNAGVNWLEGGAGADTLTGGGEADQFIFRPGMGVDRITDFGDVAGNEDMLYISAFGINSFLDVQALISQSGADAVISFAGGDQIVLTGIFANTLTPDDFLF